MNERIKQLIKEAGFSDDFIDDCELGYTQQKFAELIIKECIKLIEPNGEHRTEPNSYLGGQEGVELLDTNVEYIKQHFGIE
jgi:hypothetical protein